MTEETLIFKQHQISDILADVIMLAEYCDEDFKPPLSQRPSLEEYLHQFNNANSQVICAYLNTKIVGFLGIHIKHPDFKTSWYQCIMVKKEVRKRGVASSLLMLGDNLLKYHKIPKVYTRTWSNNQPSINLITKNLFHLISLKLDDRGTGIDTLIFEKYLIKQ